MPFNRKTHTVKLLYWNIDQTLVNSLHSLLDLLNRWIRLSCYCNRVFI